VAVDNMYQGQSLAGEPMDLHYWVRNPESEPRRVVLRLTRNTLPTGWQVQSTPALGETLDVAPHAGIDALLHVVPDGLHGPGGVITVEERLHRIFGGCWGHCLGGPDSSWESEGGYLRTTGGISFAVTAPWSPTAVVLSGLDGRWTGRAIELTWSGHPATGFHFELGRRGPGEVAFTSLGVATTSGSDYRYDDNSAVPGRQYTYRVDYVGPKGVAASFGPVLVEAGMPAWLVSRPYPNPSRGAVTLDCSVPATTVVWVAVYDVSGRCVVRRNLGLRDPGSFSFVWDGRDATGRPAGAGAYLMRVTAGPNSIERRVVMLR